MTTLSATRRKRNRDQFGQTSGFRVARASSTVATVGVRDGGNKPVMDWSFYTKELMDVRVVWVGR